MMMQQFLYLQSAVALRLMLCIGRRARSLDIPDATVWFERCCLSICAGLFFASQTLFSINVVAEALPIEMCVK